MVFQEHVALKDQTTFKIGGFARYFCRVEHDKDIMEAVSFAHEKKLPFFVLGGGSNVLISDKGFQGLVIKMDILGIEFFNRPNGTVEVVAGAGESWDFLVGLCVDKNLYGLENLSAIPGTVGAAPVQNIGAYGEEVKNSIKQVEVFDTEDLKIKILNNKQCKFSYRDSIFKKPGGKNYIITKVVFDFKQNSRLKTDYKDVAMYLEENKIKEPTLMQIRNAVIEIRSKKFPDLKRYGTAGSFFKNPIVSIGVFKNLQKKYPDLPSFTVSKTKIKIPAAWLLDHACGYKGIKEGNVGTYENQALVLVNYGGASAEETYNLAEKMREGILEKTGIKLEFEVQLVG